ncbi:MAG: recombinase family protein, partial [Pseudomonadota bacterium]
MKTAYLRPEENQRFGRLAWATGHLLSPCSERFLFDQDAPLPSSDTPRAIGYLRVSTADQRMDRQDIGLRDFCDEMHVETVSGAAKTRPVFDQVLKRLRPGDTLLVWDFDRAFRSTLDAIQTSELLMKRGVRLQILRMNLDTSTAEGEFFYTIMAAMAQFERRLLSRRTREGLAAARAKGVKLGRPRRLETSEILAA